LQKYLKICEQFINGKITIFEAGGRERDDDEWDVYDDEDDCDLDDEERAEREKEKEEARKEKEEEEDRKQNRLFNLNEEYKFLVCSKTLRNEILASKLASWWLGYIVNLLKDS